MNSELILYPNPATDILKIETGTDVIDRVSIYDISGKLISEKNDVNSTRTFFNTNGLPSGLYIIEVVGDDGVPSRDKVIVAREE